MEIKQRHTSSSSTAPSLRLKISGMDCIEEVATLKRELAPIVGDENRLSFDVLKGSLTIRPGGDAAFEKMIVTAVARTGMTALRTSGTTLTTTPVLENRDKLFCTVASGLFGFVGLAIHSWRAGGVLAALGSEGLGAGEVVPLLSRLVYSAGILSGIVFVLSKAWFALRQFRPDMNLLMVVAIMGAIALGDWFEAATVAFLFSVSLTLESWSVSRARRAVEALLQLSLPTANYIRPDGATEAIPCPDVPVGGRIVVKPGERVPLDGVVRKGSSHVDQSPITGESTPIVKEQDQPVFAGTINGEGALEIETTKSADDTTLAHIIRMVDQAQSRRARSEQWIERFARVYTPAVMGLSLLVLLVPTLVFQQDWQTWLYRSLVLLVIACPCALVISTPVSIVAALAAAARQGVLVKGGIHLENPAKLKALALDKTGTLTEGKPAVVEIVPWNEHNERELLERASRLEAHSEHPLALAIQRKAHEEKINLPPAEDVKALPGKGVHGRIEKTGYWLGSHRYLEERGQETPEIHERLETLARAGRSIVVVGNERHVCGFIAVADRIRPETRTAIAALRNSGIAHIVMLTGDNRATAEAIARESGIDEVRAELLPAEKVTAIQELVAKYGSVAMVGDGINDAPALGQASVGIAMGAAGSDAAIEAADIALMSDDLSKIAWLVNHSKRTLGIVRQNIVLSLGVKAIFTVLAMSGHASLWAAIAADMGASLLVIGNGLRLLRG
jgi:Cd2+/Zn2+-exporting ATPase